MKRTLEGTRLKKIKKSGFRARLTTHAGRETLKRRRHKGRKRLAASL